MNRRTFLAGASGAAAVFSAYSQTDRPNIILMMADDLGYQDLGCTGADYIKTPHIDSLAESGSRFTNWYSNAPVCAPSRASLMTGKYPQRAGVPNNGLDLSRNHLTIASVLKRAGYTTGLTGKWHLGSTDTAPNAHGFDYFYGFHAGCVDFYSHRFYWGEPRRVNFHDLWRDRTEIFEDGQYLTDRIGQEAVSFIEGSKGRPYFLYVPFNAPHYPMHAPKMYMDRFKGLPLEQQTRAAMLAAVDDAVGRILSAAGDRNTIVLFTADNGATREPRAGLNQNPPVTGSNAPFRGFKFSLFDGGMHTPMVIRWKDRVPAGRVNAEIGMHMDLLPTLCAAAGATPPEGLDGKNLLPAITGTGKSPHETIFWESGKQQAVRRGQWKLVLNGIEWSGPVESRQPLTGDDAVWLSNLENDPGESRNLSRAHPGIVAGLRKELTNWHEVEQAH
jgi:arylsulfatase A-like enzyme